MNMGMHFKYDTSWCDYHGHQFSLRPLCVCYTPLFALATDSNAFPHCCCCRLYSSPLLLTCSSLIHVAHTHIFDLLDVFFAQVWFVDNLLCRSIFVFYFSTSRVLELLVCVAHTASAAHSLRWYFSFRIVARPFITSATFARTNWIQFVAVFVVGRCQMDWIQSLIHFDLFFLRVRVWHLLRFLGAYFSAVPVSRRTSMGVGTDERFGSGPNTIITIIAWLSAWEVNIQVHCAENHSDYRWSHYIGNRGNRHNSSLKCYSYVANRSVCARFLRLLSTRSNIQVEQFVWGNLVGIVAAARPGFPSCLSPPNTVGIDHKRCIFYWHFTTNTAISQTISI